MGIPRAYLKRRHVRKEVILDNREVAHLRGDEIHISAVQRRWSAPCALSQGEGTQLVAKLRDDEVAAPGVAVFQAAALLDLLHALVHREWHAIARDDGIEDRVCVERLAPRKHRHTSAQTYMAV